MCKARKNRHPPEKGHGKSGNKEIKEEREEKYLDALEELHECPANGKMLLEKNKEGNLRKQTEW